LSNDPHELGSGGRERARRSVIGLVYRSFDPDVVGSRQKGRSEDQRERRIELTSRNDHSFSSFCSSSSVVEDAIPIIQVLNGLIPFAKVLAVRKASKERREGEGQVLDDVGRSARPFAFLDVWEHLESERQRRGILGSSSKPEASRRVRSWQGVQGERRSSVVGWVRIGNVERWSSEYESVEVPS